MRQLHRLIYILMALLLLGAAPFSFANIILTTRDTTTIAGANVAAADTLSIDTKNLNVESVQDSTERRSAGEGINVSGSTATAPGSGGINGSVSHERSRDTVLTTLTGGNVAINVAEETTLTGATIAAVDSEGNDTGNLSLTTGTLQVNALSNTTYSTATSANVGAGQTVSIDASADTSHSKTKTLGTIGEGNIQVANIDESDTTLLNRDVTDNEVDIYAIESHKGLKGSLDTRFLTEQGRDQIAEDVLKSGMIVDTIKLIVTTDKVGIEDFFSETDKSHTTYETVKETIAKDPNLAAMLQDPNLSAQEKEAMLNQVTAAVMEKLGYETYDNNVIAKDDIRSGYYSEETGDAYINDRNIRDTEGLVTVAGHEMAHAMDDQSGDNTQYSEADRETYASLYGSNFADYTDMALDINGYDDGMAGSNSHTGNNSAYVQANNQEYNGLDKSKGDNCFGLCSGPALIALTAYLLSGSEDANAPGVDEIPTESGATFPTDLAEEELFNQLEAATGVPVVVLMALDPKMLGKKGIKNADELVEAIRKGDIDPNDLKNSSAKNPANSTKLNKQLGSEQQLSETGVPIAGHGTKTELRKAEKLADEYGGDASDWAKKSSTQYTAPDGRKYETHWYENSVTGQRVEQKTIVEEYLKGPQ